MSAVPVGLPDVQHIGVGDLHVVCLIVQEVEEIFDSVWGSVVRRPPDGSEQVLHKGMHRHLKEKEQGNVFFLRSLTAFKKTECWISNVKTKVCFLRFKSIFFNFAHGTTVIEYWALKCR